MGDFAEIAAGAGYIDEISAIVDETLERAERNQELWAFAEVLRVKGRLLLSRNEPDPDQAEEYVVRSLDRARALRELSWELRAAMSLARLKRDQGRVEEARDLLASVWPLHRRIWHCRPQSRKGIDRRFTIASGGGPRPFKRASEMTGLPARSAKSRYHAANKRRRSGYSIVLSRPAR
jgi:hypothetical protein